MDAYWQFLKLGITFGLFGIAFFILIRTIPAYNISLDHAADRVNTRVMTAEVNAPASELDNEEKTKEVAEPKMSASQVYYDVMNYKGSATVKVGTTVLSTEDINNIQNNLNERYATGGIQKLNLALFSSNKDSLFTKQIKDGMIVYTPYYG